MADMVNYYAFAGLEFSVSTPDERMYGGDHILSLFRTKHVENPHNFTISLVEQLTPPTGKLVASTDNFAAYWDGDTRLRYTGVKNNDFTNAYMRACHQGKTHVVELKSSVYHNGTTANSILNAVELEHLITEVNGFVFHSSFIDIGGKGILFTAPSGTGKSTQADLWHDLRGARILNGDRSAVRSTKDGVVACGIPFMGSSQYCENVTLPLAGIVYLTQSPQTTIRQLRGAEAFRRVWEGISVNTWDKDDMNKIMDTVSQLITNIPVWHLSCTPDESAVVALAQQLGK